MLGWVVFALIAAAVFVVLVLPYIRMPDVSNTPWDELARGVAPGEVGHQPDSPYFILATNDSAASAVAALKRRLTTEGWRVDKDPAPAGGVTFVRANDPGTALSFSSYPTQTLDHLRNYSVSPDRLRDWQRRYAHIYILQMFFP